MVTLISGAPAVNEKKLGAGAETSPAIDRYRLIDLLNEDLAREYQSIIAYVVYSQVLKGAERLLKEDRPVILSELHSTQLQRASGVTADEFLAQLPGFGYRAQDLSGNPIDRASPDGIVSVVLVPLG